MAEHKDCFVCPRWGDTSCLSIHHNLLDYKKKDGLLQSSSTPHFDVEYFHESHIKNGEFYEIKIDEFGDFRDAGIKVHEENHMILGIGVWNPKNFYGINVNFQKKIINTDGDCKSHSAEEGDIIKVQADVNGFHVTRGDQPLFSTKNVNPDDGYKLFIGMNQYFERVTLLCNKSFASLYSADEKNFSKNKMRILVTSMNEGSPLYGKGVANGGQHLLMDGMLVRRLCENNVDIVNYSPGASSFVYDAKAAGCYDLEDMLPTGLLRVRGYLGGNELTIRRMHTCDRDEYNVHLRSTLTGIQQVFHGTNYDWNQQRNQLLGHGEKYLINLPSKNGSLQTNDLKIAGTKCKTICRTVGASLAWKVGDKDKVPPEVPRVLLMGGDRSQSIGSITGALNAYEDLCMLYFDAHFDMRDPNASHYPMVHGSPLFFLLGQQVRDQANKLDQNDIERCERAQIEHAISFLTSTEEGKRYWEDFKNGNNDYRGFEWMKHSKKIDSKRIVFVGMRSKTWEAGSTLGGPLPLLFKNLLQLDGQMYTSEDVRHKGVSQVFKETIKTFRNSFTKEHLAKKDEEEKQKSGGKRTEWIPPFMVSWDADSIDPHDLPCTIAQEASGLSSEECLAFCDEIAATDKMVLMEIIEFNPELWKGYLDEPIQLTLNDFLAGGYMNELRTPQNISGQRLDRQKSVKLLQDMIVRASKTE